MTTFGSHAAVAAEASRVNRLHDRVSGSYSVADAGGSQTRPYRAADQDLLLWVHLAFTESFLAAHNTYSSDPVDADDYVRLWARSVEPLGLQSVPVDFAGLQAGLASFDGVLRADADTQQVVRFIRRVKLPWYARPMYRLLWLAAVDSLQPKYRELLGLNRPAAWVRPVTKGGLRFLRWVIGPESPIEDGALRRLERLGVI